MSTFARTVSAKSTPAWEEFRGVFDREFGYVCRALRRLGVREADLQDVAQELFVAVHSRFTERDPDGAIRPWLFSFALRYAANYRRLARHREGPLDEMAESGPPSDVRAEARDLVLRGLEKLDFDRRTVFVMHDLEGFPAPDIASQLGIPLNTAYSRLRLAREDFRGAVTALQRKGGSS